MHCCIYIEIFCGNCPFFIKNIVDILTNMTNYDMMIITCEGVASASA